jgi:two-component system, NtrC family, sensor kinase
MVSLPTQCGFAPVRNRDAYPKRDSQPPTTAARRRRWSARDGTSADELDERLARLAHELKVPVSVIAGSLDNLEQYLEALVHFVAATRTHLDAHPELARLYTDLGLAYVSDNAPALLKICRQGSRRLTAMMQQLRFLTQHGSFIQPRLPVDVAQVLDESVRLVEATHPARPLLHLDVGHDVTVLGAAEELGQAFVNLVYNAFDASLAVEHPEIWISAYRVVGGSHEAGAWVEVVVRDNGLGVPATQRETVFAPFFTTKSHSAGMGLGLAITKDIVDAHGGTVRVEDAPTGGATFVVRLPAQKG